MLAVTGTGSVSVWLADAVQPLASVTVTVILPIPKPVALLPDCPLLQAKAYVPVPPLADAIAFPLAAPLQVGLVGAMFAVTGVGSVSVSVAVAVQLFASVTVTLIAPTVKFIAGLAVWASLHV